MKLLPEGGTRRLAPRGSGAATTEPSEGPSSLWVGVACPWERLCVLETSAPSQERAWRTAHLEQPWTLS